MPKLKIRTRLLVVTAGVAAWSGLAAGPSVSVSSAATQLTWGPIQTGYDNEADDAGLNGVSCPTTTDCAVVGWYDNTTGKAPRWPMLALIHEGDWSFQTELDTIPGGELNAISCPTATTCFAVGDQPDPNGDTVPLAMQLTLSGGSMTYQTVPVAQPAVSGSATEIPSATLSGVSCTSASACTAVGTYKVFAPITDPDGGTSGPPATKSGLYPLVEQLAGSSFAAEPVTPPAPASLTTRDDLSAVSCPPGGGSCEAVGNYDDTGGNLAAWTVPITAGATGSDHTIAWPADETREVTNVDGLLAVSCPTADACTAAGSYPHAVMGEGDGQQAVAVPIAGGVPGTVVALPGTLAADAAIFGISCWDAGDCAVSGRGNSFGVGMPPPVAGNESDGFWAPLSLIPLDSDLYWGPAPAVSCPGPENCTTVGVEKNDYPEDSKPWYATSPPPPTITGTSLPAAQVGQPYQGTFFATGGVGPYTWSIYPYGGQPATLPAGLTLDPATGVISGTPTAADPSFGTAVLVTDADGHTAIRGFRLPVAPAAATTDAGAPTNTAAPPADPPAAHPAPSTAPAGAAAVRFSPVSLSGTRATVTVSCAGAGGACTGAATLSAHVMTHGRRRVITIATERYSLTPGASQTITLHLNRSGRRLLARRHTLHATLNAPGAAAPRAVTLHARR